MFSSRRLQLTFLIMSILYLSIFHKYDVVMEQLEGAESGLVESFHLAFYQNMFAYVNIAEPTICCFIILYIYIYACIHVSNML